MKKISKAIIGFFDKWLITPLTKFFVNLYKFLTSKENSFEKVLGNRQVLVILSLLFALITFYAIDQKHITLIDNSAEVLYNQEVNVNYNEELYVVEGVPETVDITLVGRKNDVYLAKQYPFDGVTLDLTGYTAGTYNVGFKYEQFVPSVTYKVDPSTVNIRIYEKESRNKELSYDILHKESMSSILNIENVLLDRDSVIVKGAKHQLDNIAIVKAVIDLDKLSKIEVGTITVNNAELIAYDSNGNKMDVEIVPSNVTATLKISSPNKEVPIKVITEGESEDYSIKNITTDVSTVVVYGNENVISEIEYLPVTVDITGIKGNKTFTVNVSKPNGIREVSVKTVNVNVEVDKSTTKDITGLRIETINVGDGLKVQAVNEESSNVTIILRGSAEVISTFDDSKIKPYVDLTGLDVGEHTVPIKVTCDDNRVTCTPRIKEVTIKIVRK